MALTAATRSRTSSRSPARSPDGRLPTRTTARSASRRRCTIAAPRRFSARRSRPAAASRTASACSTSSRRIHRRRGTLRPSWRGASSATIRREALVARVAARFTATDGDLRETVRAVVTSPEFFAAEYRGAKTKTPLEFVVSAVRTTGRQVRDARQLLNGLQQLGHDAVHVASRRPDTTMRRKRGSRRARSSRA